MKVLYETIFVLNKWVWERPKDGIDYNSDLNDVFRFQKTPKKPPVLNYFCTFVPQPLVIEALGTRTAFNKTDLVQYGQHLYNAFS